MIEVEEEYLEALEAFAHSKPTEFDGYKLQYKSDKVERLKREQRNKPKKLEKAEVKEEKKHEKVKEEPKPKEEEQTFSIQIEPPVEVVGVLSEDDADPAPAVEETGIADEIDAEVSKLIAEPLPYKQVVPKTAKKKEATTDGNI